MNEKPSHSAVVRSVSSSRWLKIKCFLFDMYLDKRTCPFCAVALGEEEEICPRCGSYVGPSAKVAERPVVVKVVMFAMMALIWVVVASLLVAILTK